MSRLLTRFERRLTDCGEEKKSENVPGSEHFTDLQISLSKHVRFRVAIDAQC